MRIIQRYYTKEFFIMFSIIAVGVTFIFSLLDLIDKIDDFMPGRPSIFELALYVIYNLPKYLYYLLPTALLITSLFIFSQASRNKEITSIKASGGRLKSVFYPFIGLGVFFSIFGFIVGEVIVPDFSEKLQEMKNTLKREDKKLSFKEGTIWLKGTDGSFIRIELYMPEKNFAKNVSVFIIKDSQLKRRIEAEEASWAESRNSKGIWTLKNVIIYDMERSEIGKIQEMHYAHLESPNFFRERIKKPEEMGIIELGKYEGRLKAAGVRDAKIKVDLNSKVSYPFTNLFMMLLGLSLSVNSRIGGGLFAAGLGIFISFIYWLLYTMMLSMGYAGILPPLFATWITPVGFGIKAIILFRKIPE